ncbi:MAG: hypothetical protein ACK5LK_04770 [Chthoniobacterales bacterium]
MKKIITLLATSLLLALSLHAQDKNTLRLAVDTYWTAILPGGEYTVPHSKITSIGKHSYEVDGTFSVTEVTVGTEGSEIGRFYYFEPVTPESPVTVGQSALDAMKEKVMELNERSGQNLTTKVIKNYPTTTHAHTMEFRLETEEQLDKLYDNLKSSYTKRRNQTYKIGPKE